MGSKHDATEIVSIEAAENLFKFGLAVVVTDGKYIQLGEDNKEWRENK